MAPEVQRGKVPLPRTAAGSAGSRLTDLLADDVHAHAARGALHHLHGLLHVFSVEVHELDLGDFLYLLKGELAHFVLFRNARTLGKAGGFLYESGHRGHLGDEGESPVFVHREDDGYRHALLQLAGLFIELFAEVHDVDAVLTERGTYGGRGVRGAGRDLKFYLCFDRFNFSHSNKLRLPLTSLLIIKSGRAA